MCIKIACIFRYQPRQASATPKRMQGTKQIIIGLLVESPIITQCPYLIAPSETIAMVSSRRLPVSSPHPNPVKHAMVFFCSTSCQNGTKKINVFAMALVHSAVCVTITTSPLTFTHTYSRHSYFYLASGMLRSTLGDDTSSSLALILSYSHSSS